VSADERVELGETNQRYLELLADESGVDVPTVVTVLNATIPALDRLQRERCERREERD
jgi:hypothetical protein